MLKKIISLSIATALGASLIWTSFAAEPVKYTLKYEKTEDLNKLITNEDVTFTADKLFYIKTDIEKINNLSTFLEDKNIDTTYVCIENQEIMGVDFNDYKKNVTTEMESNTSVATEDKCNQEFVLILASEWVNEITLPKNSELIKFSLTGAEYTNDTIKEISVLNTKGDAEITFSIEDPKDTVEEKTEQISKEENKGEIKEEVINTKKTWFNSLLIALFAITTMFSLFWAFKIIRD